MEEGLLGLRLGAWPPVRARVLRARRSCPELPWPHGADLGRRALPKKSSLRCFCGVLRALCRFEFRFEALNVGSPALRVRDRYEFRLRRSPGGVVSESSTTLRRRSTLCDASPGRLSARIRSRRRPFGAARLVRIESPPRSRRAFARLRRTTVTARDRRSPAPSLTRLNPSIW